MRIKTLRDYTGGDRRKVAHYLACGGRDFVLTP